MGGCRYHPTVPPRLGPVRCLHTTTLLVTAGLGRVTTGTRDVCRCGNSSRDTDWRRRSVQVSVRSHRQHIWHICGLSEPDLRGNRRVVTTLAGDCCLSHARIGITLPWLVMLWLFLPMRRRMRARAHRHTSAKPGSAGCLERLSRQQLNPSGCVKFPTRSGRSNPISISR